MEAEDNSEHHTRRRENLKSHMLFFIIFEIWFLSPGYLDPI
jgi:hypothetical protein